MKRVIILVIGCLVFYALPINAATVEFEVTAEVTEVEDTGGLLQGKIVPGSIIEGSYIFDSDTPDDYPDASGYGEYHHYSSPFGISLAIEGFVFQTNQSNVNFCIFVANDFYPSHDSYVVESNANDFLYEDVKISKLKLLLYDPAANALNSDELLIDAPYLENWETKELLLGGGKYDAWGRPIDEFSVMANITRLVPEPSSMILIGMCFFAVVKNRKIRQ